jgi:hypothetical protein
MKKIIVDKDLIINHFFEANKKWTSEDNMELITKIDEQDLNLVVPKLIDLLPKELANSILSDLLERPSFPIQYINQIYNKGDKGCKMTICLRDDLPIDIANMCENSLDKDIKTHFINRKNFLNKKNN